MISQVDSGYPHDGRADTNPYPHACHADKDSYPHDSNYQDTYRHNGRAYSLSLSDNVESPPVC